MRESKREKRERETERGRLNDSMRGRQTDRGREREKEKVWERGR